MLTGSSVSVESDLRRLARSVITGDLPYEAELETSREELKFQIFLNIPFIFVSQSLRDLRTIAPDAESLNSSETVAAEGLQVSESNAFYYSF